MTSFLLKINLGCYNVIFHLLMIYLKLEKNWVLKFGISLNNGLIETWENIVYFVFYSEKAKKLAPSWLLWTGRFREGKASHLNWYLII